jgi:16S rRNA (guanine966-N2)-methyltransferase
MVKESIFNLIEHSNKINLPIKNSIILDLFSGSGSFGLEALSRGAKNVIFIENYFKVINILKKNISNLKYDNQCNLINIDCFEFLNSKKKFNNYFDIIFLDPPYKEQRINVLIEQIIEKKILKKNGFLIIHRHKKDSLIISEKLKIFDTRVYGISKVIFGH